MPRPWFIEHKIAVGIIDLIRAGEGGIGDLHDGREREDDIRRDDVAFRARHQHDREAVRGHIDRGRTIDDGADERPYAVGIDVVDIPADDHDRLRRGEAKTPAHPAAGEG